MCHLIRIPSSRTTHSFPVNTSTLEWYHFKFPPKILQRGGKRPHQGCSQLALATRTNGHTHTHTGSTRCASNTYFLCNVRCSPLQRPWLLLMLAYAGEVHAKTGASCHRASEECGAEVLAPSAPRCITAERTARNNRRGW